MVLENYYELMQNVKEIAARYFLYQQKLRKGDSDLVAEDISNYEKFIDRTNESFNNLDEIDKEIINNEFFYQEHPNWWKKYYSKGDFEKRKKVAMKQFVLNFVEAGKDD